MSEYVWPDADFQALPAYIREVRALLGRWFDALQEQERTGAPIPWLPDPLGPQVTEEIAQRVVDSLEKNVWEREKGWLTSTHVRGGPFEAGPGFERLTYSQRIALIQEWSALKRKHAAAEAARKKAEAQQDADNAALLRQMYRYGGLSDADIV